MRITLSACPCCQAPLKTYTPENAKFYEAWEFECGAEVLRMESGRLTAEATCYRLMSKALAAINKSSVLEDTQ